MIRQFRGSSKLRSLGAGVSGAGPSRDHQILEEKLLFLHIFRLDGFLRQLSGQNTRIQSPFSVLFLCFVYVNPVISAQNRGRLVFSDVLSLFLLLSGLVLIQSIVIGASMTLWRGQSSSLSSSHISRTSLHRFLLISFLIAGLVSFIAGRLWRYLSFLTSKRLGFLLLDGIVVYLAFFALMNGLLQSSLIHFYGVSGLLIYFTVSGQFINWIRKSILCCVKRRVKDASDIRLSALTKVQLTLATLASIAGVWALFSPSEGSNSGNISMILEKPGNPSSVMVGSLWGSIVAVITGGLPWFAMFLALRFTDDCMTEVLSQNNRVNGRLKPLSLLIAAFIALCLISVGTFTSDLSSTHSASIVGAHNSNNLLNYRSHAGSEVSSKMMHRRRQLLSSDKNNREEVSSLAQQLAELQRQRQSAAESGSDKNGALGDRLKNMIDSEQQKGGNDGDQNGLQPENVEVKPQLQVPMDHNGNGDKQEASNQQGLDSILSNKDDPQSLVAKGESDKDEPGFSSWLWSMISEFSLASLFGLFVILSDSSMRTIQMIVQCGLYGPESPMNTRSKLSSDDRNPGSAAIDSSTLVDLGHCNDANDLASLVMTPDSKNLKIRNRDLMVLQSMLMIDMVPSHLTGPVSDTPSWFRPLMASRVLLTAQCIGLLWVSVLTLPLNVYNFNSDLFDPFQTCIASLVCLLALDLGFRALKKIGISYACSDRPRVLLRLTHTLLVVTGLVSSYSVRGSYVSGDGPLSLALSCLNIGDGHTSHSHSHSHSHSQKGRSSIQNQSMYMSALVSLMDVPTVLKHLRSDGQSRRLFYFLLINFSFMFVEFVYGYWSNSLGLISDAFHMLFDCLALAIGFVASYLSSPVLESSPKHGRQQAEQRMRLSYGAARLRVISGFVNGAFLVYIGFSVLIEALERLVNPPEIENTDMLLLVSISGLLVNMVGLYFFSDSHIHGGHAANHSDHTSHGHSHSHSHGSHGSHHNNADHNMRGVFLHVLADTLGSVGVIISSVLISAYQWTIADTLCSVFISILIFMAVYPLLNSTFHILLLQTPAKVMRSFKSDFNETLAVTGVKGYRLAHFWEYEPGRIVGSLHVFLESDANEQHVLSQLTKVVCRRFAMSKSDLTIQCEKQGFLDQMDPVHQSALSEIVPVHRRSVNSARKSAAVVVAGSNAAASAAKAAHSSHSTRSRAKFQSGSAHPNFVFNAAGLPGSSDHSSEDSSAIGHSHHSHAHHAHV